MYCLHMKLVLLVLCSDSNISIMMSDKTAIRLKGPLVEMYKTGGLSCQS